MFNLITAMYCQRLQAFDLVEPLRVDHNAQDHDTWWLRLCAPEDHMGFRRLYRQYPFFSYFSISSPDIHAILVSRLLAVPTICNWTTKMPFACLDSYWAYKYGSVRRFLSLWPSCRPTLSIMQPFSQYIVRCAFRLAYLPIQQLCINI